jgi:phosphoribosyl-ATP pyrophosphohydrolase
MNNQNYFDRETAEMLEKIEEETKKILAGDYEKIEQEIKEEVKDLEYLIN